MNQTIENFARNELIAKIQLITEANFMVFKRMYSPKNLEASIQDVVKNMPCEQLDWALTQVENTLKKMS